MTPREAARLVKKHGSIKAAARAERRNGHTYNEIQTSYAQAVAEGKAPKRDFRSPKGTFAARTGKISVALKMDSQRGRLDTGYRKPTKVKRLGTGRSHFHIFTCAQNNTKVHAEFWTNLQAFAKHTGATIHVARLTYRKDSYRAQFDKTEKLYSKEELWWDEKVVPFIDDSRTEVAPHLRWCGDLDILPTATRPLSGLEAYTGRASSIFPHPKIALESVPGGKNQPTKLLMTTGTVTLRNYIQRKAGMKADFHHCYGALFVEVDANGYWYPRQINADSTGAFYDLDRYVKNGKVTGGHRVEAIYWADPQIVEENKELIALAFGRGGMKDALKPKHEFMGDVGSFKSRSHWDQKDAYKKFLRHVQGLGSVLAESAVIAEFLALAHRPWCKTKVLDGNHERHIGRWLRENNGLQDPLNAEIWTELNTAVLRYIRKHQDEPNYLSVLLSVAGQDVPKDIRFLRRDESFIVCKGAGGGIECGEHGDDGTHGGRGSTAAHARSAQKKCLGHAWAQIYDGIYRASSFSRPNLDWCHGNTAMNTCASVLIYPNGKRALVFMFANKWRA